MESESTPGSTTKCSSLTSKPYTSNSENLSPVQTLHKSPSNSTFGADISTIFKVSSTKSKFKKRTQSLQSRKWTLSNYLSEALEPDALKNIPRRNTSQKLVPATTIPVRPFSCPGSQTVSKSNLKLPVSESKSVYLTGSVDTDARTQDPSVCTIFKVCSHTPKRRIFPKPRTCFRELSFQPLHINPLNDTDNQPLPCECKGEKIPDQKEIGNGLLDDEAMSLASNSDTSSYDTDAGMQSSICSNSTDEMDSETLDTMYDMAEHCYTQESSTCTLPFPHFSKRWYKNQGKLYHKNCVRDISRLSRPQHQADRGTIVWVDRTQVSGSLEDNIMELEKNYLARQTPPIIWPLLM